MDKEISKSEIQKRKTKTWVWVGLIAVLLALSAWILRGSLKTSVKQNDLHIAHLEKRQLENDSRTRQAMGAT